MNTADEIKKSLEGVDTTGMIMSVKPGYAHKIVTFDPDKIEGLTDAQLMYIADGGFSYFGGVVRGHVVKIYTD